MTDWRDSGKDILAEFESARRPAAMAISAGLSSAMNSFGMAVVRWAGMERNPEPLVEWLRSDRPIGEFDRNMLADAIESTKLEPLQRKRGRPRDRDLHDAASMARWIFRRWRRLDAERGINDYGHRSEMMDEAIRMAIELEHHANVDPEAVRELIERPASRQK